jgi:hypothetical protein
MRCRCAATALPLRFASPRWASGVGGGGAGAGALAPLAHPPTPHPYLRVPPPLGGVRGGSSEGGGWGLWVGRRVGLGASGCCAGVGSARLVFLPAFVDAGGFGFYARGWQSAQRRMPSAARHAALFFFRGGRGGGFLRSFSPFAQETPPQSWGRGRRRWLRLSRRGRQARGCERSASEASASELGFRGGGAGGGQGGAGCMRAERGAAHGRSPSAGLGRGVAKPPPPRPAGCA